jgi:mono/diheme cytochrome c family protein
MIRIFLPLSLLVAAVLAGWSPLRAELPASAVDFFEKEVRPVLVERCVKCHGGEKVRGGLKLTSGPELRRGGDTGPVVAPGKPDDSLLIKAVRYTNPDLKMPPAGKLTPEQIAALETWVRMGAPDPRDGTTTVKPPPTGNRSHWALQPIASPPVPPVRNKDWVRAPIDAFVLARLEGSGLAPSPPADRRTLLRRAYFDLIGLPPTWEEVQAFEKDQAEGAFARVVDRLLASPQYGERWGRHWLDVARFADTKDGVLMYGDDRIRPFAYTYRDYVIRAFNEDLPFDRFVREQLAADLIQPAEPARLAAMGYLTLGRMFDSNIHDVIDDRIDTVSRGLLGLTVSCARCHDHKYDPIPTADYYSLYGVFRSSEAPLVPPLLDPKTPGPLVFEAKYSAKEREIRDMLELQYALLSETARLRATDYLVRVATTKPDPMETAIFFLSLAPEDLRPPIIARWRTFILKRATPDDPVFGPWHDLFALPNEGFGKGVPAVLARWKDRPKLNPLVRDALLAARIETREDVARTYGVLMSKVYDEAKRTKDPPDAARKPLLEILTGRDSPAYFPKSQVRRYMSRSETDAFGQKLRDLDHLAVKEPKAPPRAMALVDSAELFDPQILVRGNPARTGDAVPRQFLSVLAGEKRKQFPNGSGRLDLANAITAPDNPLTARVFVNRVWMHHFGEPLVATPNDFGLRTPQPIQADLLDHLATTFRQGEWSVKKLHRAILLSNTYQQASFDRPDVRRRDPENRLLWRANRQRLDLEAMRDSLLAASGRLDLTLYGRPVDVANDPLNRRRTVYGLVDRQSLPGMFRAFDFASPDQSAERRTLTTVPQQALFGMNSPFMTEQAKGLAARPEVAKATEPAEKIRQLYRLVLQREPEADELHIGVRFLTAPETSAEKSSLPPLVQFAQVLLLTNELMFVD